MSQWRLYTIRLLVAVFLLLLVLFLSHIEAQRSEEIDNYYTFEEEKIEKPQLPYLCDLENVDDSQVNVYEGHGLRRLHDYVDDEVLAVDVDVEEENEEEVYEEFYQGHGFSLPHCPQNLPEDADDRALVLVSTLDGHITALDLASGAVLWSHETGDGTNSRPLLSSSMSKLEVTSRGEWVRLIPSLDGGLFRFDGEGVEPLPVTADTLLHSSFKFNPDTIFTGAKITEVSGLALGSGRVVYVCLASGCHRQDTAAPHPPRLLVVRRVTQTVRAVDPRTGDERWNFSVGQHEVNLGGGGGCGSEGVKGRDAPSPPLPSLHFVVPDGVVMGMDQDQALLWQQKLTSPVVNAWRVLKDELQEVDLFSTATIPALAPDKTGRATEEAGGPEKQAALYVGVHQQQLYIQQSNKMHHHFNSATRLFTAEDSPGTQYPRVKWRPLLASAPSRTPIINPHQPQQISFEARGEANTAVALTHHLDYPYDNGYYLEADENLGLLNFSRPWNRPDDEEDEETLMDEVTAQFIRICIHVGPNAGITLGIAGVCCSFLLYLLLRHVLLLLRTRDRRELILDAQLFTLILQGNPQIVAMLHRMGIRLEHLPPPLPSPPPPPQLQEGEREALPPTPHHQDTPPPPTPHHQDTPPPPPPQPSVERTDSNSDYSSRYLTDFEVVQRLGRGGFGVVCQVRNKLDENEYAVKRINLPSNKSSAERVKREVRALAKLNHTNIVRYYNSWLETPPPGWQDPQDTLHSGDVLSLSSPYSPCSEEYPSEVPEPTTPEQRPLDIKGLSGVLEGLGGVGEGLGAQGGVGGPVVTLSSGLTSGYEEEEEEDSVISSSDGSSVSKNIRVTRDTRERDSSFEVVFEGSEGVREEVKGLISVVVSDGDTESFSGLLRQEETADSTQNEKLSERLSDKSSSDDGFIVFKNSDRDDSGTDSTEEEPPSGPQLRVNKKRRRVKSQPALVNRRKGERPRTLSLGSTTADKLKGVEWRGKLKDGGNQRQNHGGKDKQRPSVMSPANPRTLMYIQMELCQKESLRDWLMQNGKREKATVLGMFSDIINAVEYVHDRHLMHRDLKPSNIFFSLEGKVKVGDFGLVTTIAEEEEDQTPFTPTTHRGGFPTPHTHRVGTRLYMSPEQLSGQVYDYKVDIYSLGLIFFEMLVPFGTGMERLEVMTRLREDLVLPAKFEEDFPDENSLLRLMLSRDPACRPTTRGIRARKPLRSLQGHAIEDICPEDHFRLSRQRSHFTSSTSSTPSLSLSSNTST